jgi:hypothetical protein
MIFHRLQILDADQGEDCWIPKRFSEGDIHQVGNGATPDNSNATLKRSIKAPKSLLLTNYSIGIRDLSEKEVMIVKSNYLRNDRHVAIHWIIDFK